MMISYRPMTINKLTASLVINLVCITYMFLHMVYRYTVTILCLIIVGLVYTTYVVCTSFAKAPHPQGFARDFCLVLGNCD